MASDIMIRTAGADDIQLIHEMAETVFRNTYAAILSPEQMEYMMDWMYSHENLRKQMAEGHTYFLASCGGRLVGYSSVQPDGMLDDGRPVFHLQKLYVMPDCQHSGVGTALFNHVVSHVSEAAPCRIELNVNRGNPAVSFYERIGMRKLREGDFPIGSGFFMNDYIMGLDILSKG